MELNLKDIRAITLDVDGVMTDGSLLGTDEGGFLRTFNAKDSFALRAAAMAGFRLAIFTGGDTEGIRRRCLTCGVPEEDIYMGCRGKMKNFRHFCEKYALEPRQVAYFGDDIPDIPVLKACGLGIAPADAAPETREAADFVSPCPGGKRCVREGVEMIMRAQGKWVFEEDVYEKIF